MPKKNRLRCIAYKTEERYLHETGRSEYSAILNLLAGVQHKPEKISPMVFLNIFSPRDTTETHNIYSTSKLDNLKEGFRDHFNYYPWIMFEDVSGNALFTLCKLGSGQHVFCCCTHTTISTFRLSKQNNSAFADDETVQFRADSLKPLCSPSRWVIQALALDLPP